MDDTNTTIYENPDSVFTAEGFESKELVEAWVKANIGESMTWAWTQALEALGSKNPIRCVFAISGKMDNRSLGKIVMGWRLMAHPEKDLYFLAINHEPAYMCEFTDDELVRVLCFRFASMLEQFLAIPNPLPPIAEWLETKRYKPAPLPGAVKTDD